MEKLNSKGTLLLIILLFDTIVSTSTKDDSLDPAPGRSPGPPTHAPTEVNQLRKQQVDTTASNSLCKTNFIRDDENLVVVNDDDATASSSSLVLDVIHDAFDTTNKPLIPELVYKVQLTKPASLDVSSFYVESYVTGKPIGKFYAYIKGRNSIDDADDKRGRRRQQQQQQQKKNQKQLKNNSNSIQQHGGEWLEMPVVRRKVYGENLDKNINKLEHQLEYGGDEENLDSDAELLSDEEDDISEVVHKVDNECPVWHDKEYSFPMNGSGNVVHRNWSLTLVDVGSNNNNTTVYFRLLYRLATEKQVVFERIVKREMIKDCNLSLKESSGTLDQSMLPEKYSRCTVAFTWHNAARHNDNAGLLVQLKRLNIPCNSPSSISFSNDASKKICGKLEEYVLDERTFYFRQPQNLSVQLVGSGNTAASPYFEFSYKLVDYCYNVSLSERNDSIFLQPKQSSNLDCNFKIHLPYGNRIAISLGINYDAKNVASAANYSAVERIELLPNNNNSNQTSAASTVVCRNGDLRIEITWHHRNQWIKCVNGREPPKLHLLTTRDNIVAIHVVKLSSDTPPPLHHAAAAAAPYVIAQSLLQTSPPSVYVGYEAVSVDYITSPQCAFGWVKLNQQFCVTAVNNIRATWNQAVTECAKRGAKLATIRAESDQKIIDQLIMNSPGYKDSMAYWIGASDKHYEGYFRWTDGFPLQYTNWFPGWSQHNNYNRQPNDDGLSQEDCIEIRRSFRNPPNEVNSPKPLLNSYMWNDRNCDVENYFLCEMPITEDTLEPDWKEDCNKTIFLSKEHPRTSIWSPAFPKHYPDNFNCLTLIFAPTGYRLVIDFEELMVENEPTCGYDYVELFEPHQNNSIYVKSPLSRSYSHFFGNIRHSRSSYLQNEFFLSRSFLKFEDDTKAINVQSYGVTHSSKVEPGQYIFKGKMSRKMCGDWNAKLKLLRYVTKGTILGIHFVSDYSHHFSGYKARITMESVASDCLDERFVSYNGSCYLFVFYPEVDWLTAQNACRGINTQLTSVATKEEESFIVSSIRNSLDFSPQGLFWVGGELAANGDFEWADGTAMNLSVISSAQIEKSGEPICLGLQTKISLGAGLYWSARTCSTIGGYVCKRKATIDHEAFIQNQTINDSYGRLTSPAFPNQYPVNVDYWIRIIGPEHTKIIMQMQKLDIEAQEECLYDYLGLNAVDTVLHSYTVSDRTTEEPQHLNASSNDNLQLANAYKRISSKQPNRDKRYWTPKNEANGAVSAMMFYNHTVTEFYKVDSLKLRKSYDDSPSQLRLCGSYESGVSTYNFISRDNEMLLHFHSDFTITGSGFTLNWNAIDISGCPAQTLTAREGFINSPHYPHFLLNNLDCSYVIQAPTDRRVLIEFSDFEIISGAEVRLNIGDEFFRPFEAKKQLNDGFFVSKGEKLIIRLQTGAQPKGKGFRAIYKTMNSITAQRTIDLSKHPYGQLFYLNYPQPLPIEVDFTQHLIAPVGTNILLELHNVAFSKNGCRHGGSIEISDNYADSNGTTWWELCDSGSSSSSSDIGVKPFSYIRDDDKMVKATPAISSSPIQIRSYLNTIQVRQKIKGLVGVKLNVTAFVQQDDNYKIKLVEAEDDSVESCNPNPCLYGGRCITNGDKHKCHCRGHNVGKFCALNICELEPCIYGQCELTPSSYKCYCQPGYMGANCDQKQNPCKDNPCESRGDCIEVKGSFQCRCHAFWEGRRCERRMRVPFKPLSERMLQEPFWLGLITVFVVLGVIGLVWCAKRHFPEKIEKLIAEESERNRPHTYHTHPSLREQLHLTTLTPATVAQNPTSTATTPAQHRSIFGRLGIRKPSILSLSSPHTPGGATARTFSLDDLLRPPPRRTPSPRKKRNNSTPSKKNVVDKKQILQQLVSPAAPGRTKVSLDELIHLSERMSHLDAADSDPNIKETTFSESNASAPAVTLSRPFSDPKLEKKVTFARLLNRVSHEMSSGSDVDIRNNPQINTSLLSIRMEPPQRANSVPPSPCTNDMRSPHSNSSNQGSASLSSSEIALHDLVYKDIRAKVRPKTTSADSIIAMFKNFATSSAGVNLPSSIIVSPSTTPDDTSFIDHGDDDTSTSEAHTPISFSSAAPDSPVFYRQGAIEVPVMDNKANSGASLLCPPTILLELPNNINKCLSPIRELPTPMPSPAVTPMMPRPQRPRSPMTNDGDETISVSFSDDENDQGKKNVKIDIQSIESDQTSAPESLLFDFTKNFMHNEAKPRPKLCVPSISISIETEAEISPSNPAKRPTNLIIPMLMVQTPSPTLEKKAPVLNACPGSPPPQSASECTSEPHFVFPPSKAQQKKLSQKSDNKAASLDFPFVPPLITITTNIDDTTESDAEASSSLASSQTTRGCGSGGVGGGHDRLGLPSGDRSGGMCYLSPFSIVTRGDRAPSESNLSSSGYSSMASPGPSRCGSNNPLFCEMDDSGTGVHIHPPSSRSPHSSILKKSSPQEKNCPNQKSGLAGTGPSGSGIGINLNAIYRRSDSETMSDDALLESNDEGIGTDHLDEKIDDSQIKSAKDLEKYLNKDMLESGKQLLLQETEVLQPTLAQLQLPSIVIQQEGSDKLSPVSSRSESPISDRHVLGKLSSLFFGKAEQQLPFTDSDGLYDFPSSDGKGASVGATQHRKSVGKRRERRSSRAGLLQSPSKGSQVDGQVKESSPLSDKSNQFLPAPLLKPATLTVVRKSPKRRYRCPIASSSSSTESLSSSFKEAAQRSTRALRTLAREQIKKTSRDSDDDAGEATPLQTFDSTEKDGTAKDLTKPVVQNSAKLGRLRAIGHQIRFLRRLEKSIKNRTRFLSGTSDSGPDAEQEDSGSDALDSPKKVTSPLLKNQSSGSHKSSGSNGGIGQQKQHHVLMRQKAYKNSLDV